MTSQGPLRIGIAGCGHAAENLHVPALRGLPSLTVVAVADVDAERTRAVAERFGIGRRYTDPADLVADPDVDIVCVCTPPSTHAAIGVAALEAGKHLLVEKPIAASLADADRLIDVAERAPDLVTMVGFNLRHHPLVREAKRHVASGAIGDVEFVRTVFSSRVRYEKGLPGWRMRRDSGGGALADVAIHHFDLWRYLLGVEVDEIYASSRSGDSDDWTAAVTARLSGGAVAAAAFSQCAAEGNDVEVVGSAGRLSISFYRFDGLEYRAASVFPGSLGGRVRAMLDTARALPGAVSAAARGGAFLDSYRSQWSHFAECVRTRGRVDCTLEDGRRALEISRAAIASADSNRPVRVGEIAKREA
jgi:myo-inositol 2-dehydrogenase / D-chiro-inositol 1-dehydrogenase